MRYTILQYNIIICIINIYIYMWVLGINIFAESIWIPAPASQVLVKGSRLGSSFKDAAIKAWRSTLPPGANGSFSCPTKKCGTTWQGSGRRGFGRGL